MTFKLLFCSALAAASLLSGCGPDAAKTKAAAPATPAAPAAATYVCPMGCEGSESAKPGTCPVCGMDLEKKG